VLAEVAGPSGAGEDLGVAEEVVNYMRAMRHGLRSKLPMGRLLLPLLLVREKRLKEPVLYLSAYLERNRKE
jgi:hypothetical protein